MGHHGAREDGEAQGRPHDHWEEGLSRADACRVAVGPEGIPCGGDREALLGLSQGPL